MTEDKENEAPQAGGRICAQLQRQQGSCHHQQQGQETLGLQAATPMPLARPFLDATPDALVEALLQVRTWDAPLPVVRPLLQVMAVPTTSEMLAQSFGPPPHALAEAWNSLAGLPELPELDFCGGVMPVKNTFINFTTASPVTRASTSQLSGDTEPKDFAPGPFNLQEAPFNLQLVEVKNTFIEFATASPATRAATSRLWGDTEPRDFAPEPFNFQESETPLENPRVISLQHSLADSTSQRGKGSNPIQLNLSVWIPPTSRASVASEAPPRPLRLAEHHFPVPADPVVRRLFQHHSL
jgi:hypothetical protein